MLDRRHRVWRRRGERYANCAVVEHDRYGGGSLIVWGGISVRSRTELLVLNGTLTGQRYINEVLQPVVLPFVQQHHVFTCTYSGKGTLTTKALLFFIKGSTLKRNQFAPFGFSCLNCFQQAGYTYRQGGKLCCKYHLLRFSILFKGERNISYKYILE